MFLKTAKFKKLLKEAYSGSGLRIGDMGDGIYLSGSYWIMWIRWGQIPKEKLAAIIEFVGEIPEDETGFCATKDGQQYELQLEDQMHVMVEAMKCKCAMEITTLLFENTHGNKWRVLQNPETGQIKMINERFIEMIDMKSVDQENGHTFPEGPLVGNTEGVFWMNNIMALYVMPRREDGYENLIRFLESIEINKVENNEWINVPEENVEEETKEA